MSYRILAAAVATTFAIAPQTSAALNLEKLMNKLGNSGQQSGNQNAGAPPAGQPAAGKSSGGGLGSAMTERYCRQMFSVAGFNKKKPVDQSLVLEEFNVKTPADFFDAYMNAGQQSSYAFPEPRFYQGEFETDRINVLFDLLLSYPSPQYLAVLISEARKQSDMPQYDHQMKVDAVAALTILHFYLKDQSTTPDRWKELAAQLQKEEHYTARVISARLLASGELGVRDPDRALSYAAEANGLRQKYTTEQGYRTMSSRNYAITSNHTVYQIVAANVKMPQAQYYMQFARQYDASLKNPMQFPELEAQLGQGLRAIEKSAGSAAQKASQMLATATAGSRMKAEKGSLDNATRNRVSDAPSDLNVDAKTMLALTRQIEKLNTLDEQQKQQFTSALADAHDSGDRAIAMMPTMMSSMLNLATQRGMAAMPAMVPYAKKLQYYSDNACSVIARWDQAALVTQSGSDQSARSSMAALISETENAGR